MVKEEQGWNKGSQLLGSGTVMTGIGGVLRAGSGCERVWDETELEIQRATADSAEER